MLTVASNIKEFSNFRILKYFSNESDFLFHSAAPFFLLEPFPSAFSPQLSYPPQRDIPRLPNAAVRQPMAGCPAAPALLPSHPPAPSLPAAGSLALWTEHSREELLQKPWNATLRVYFKAALNCKQSAIDFKHRRFFAAPASRVSTPGLCNSICNSARNRQKDQQLSISSITLHHFCVNMVCLLAYTDPKLLPPLFNSYLTAKLKRYSRC